MSGMIKLCCAALRGRLGRTMLIAISIAIGVVSVMIISIISDNGVVLINEELDSLGVSGVTLSRPEAELSEYFTNEELERIKEETYVESATPILTAIGYLKDQAIERAVLCGIDESARSVISVETIAGSRIGRGDIVGKRKICQIDEKTAEQLMGTRNPIGESIDIFLGGTVERFTIIGIVAASSNILQTSVGDLIPNMIYLPYTTLQSQLGSEHIDRIAVSFDDTYDNQTCIGRLSHLMDDKDLYSAKLQIEDLNQQRDSLNGILSIITTVMRLIGGVSLIVSGLGIMTVMLISVSEKTKEIGIKKSIGAKKRDIIFEFLFESSFISLIGCAIGMLVTFSLVLLAKWLLPMEIVISPFTILLTIMVSLLCGIVFGVYPAIKAANLKPITALRTE